jgi:O-antigen ligase
VPVQPEIYRAQGQLAHNLWVQVASEYGILPAIGLGALLVSVAWLALQAARRRPRSTSREVRTLGIIILVGLVGYVFYGVVTGDPLRHSVHWMAFASLIVMAAHLYQARAAAYAARTGPNQARRLGPDALVAPRSRSGAVGREEATVLRRSPS